MNILEILVENNLIHQDEVKEIQAALDSGGRSLDEILSDRGVDQLKLAEVRSKSLKIPLVDVDPESVSKQALDQIPEESARYYHIAPISFTDGKLLVGSVTPERLDVRDALNFIASKSGIVYELRVLTKANFDSLLDRYRGLTGEVKEALSEFDQEFDTEGDDNTTGVSLDDLGGGAETTDKSGQAKIIEDAPVTKIVATILRYATDGGASDVHVEPLKDMVRVRFRVDGVLNTSLSLPPKVHSAVAARIKILSNMKLDEKRKPQDGRFSATIEGRKIDFRTSTFPTYYGEKVVMRILDQEKGVKSIDELGLRPPVLESLRRAVKKPYGIVLISGPTGSGKSTTLYSLLKEVDRVKHNVLSLEDPVEYNIEGVSQSQVRADIGYTFANGLRTTLRQDPDIIMVGEIRDKETAQLAIQAALTGHLVFSTIHTNNAIGVVPRLIDMGVDPYMIAPTLVAAIAQRLVNRLCPDARKEVPVIGSIRETIDRQFADLPEQFRQEINIPEKVYEAGSSADCPTGIKGRAAVMEVLNMDDDLERLILEDPNEYKIEQLARSKGMLTMKEDAMLKAFAGEIAFTEVNAL